MPFPESPRVRYNKNPLEEVICQLRFPPILRIDSKLPDAFQERVRGEYPLFEEKKEPGLTLAPELEKLINTEMVSRAVHTNYEFVSADKIWKVNLTRSFLALSTKKYTSWEEFKDHLSGPLKALIDEYSPAFFTRVGLRYQDVISRSKLGFGEETGWGELLNKDIAGELASPEISREILLAARTLGVQLERDSVVRVRHGLGKYQDSPETCFMIDCDFSSEKEMGLDDAIQLLEYFKRQAARLFRWCISDRLHQSMEPVDV